MAATYYQDYTIFFRDTDDWAAAIAANGGSTTRLIGPANAATAYVITAANINPAVIPATDKYILTGSYPSTLITTSVDSAAIPIDFFYAPDNPGGRFNSPGSPAGTLYWRAFLLVAAKPNTDPAKEALQTHRWMNGFERPSAGENEAGGSPTQRKMRDASRTLDGMGLALRSPANETVVMALPTTGTGFPTKDSWERIYVRLRKYPLVNEMIWGCKGDGEAGMAGLLLVGPSGQLLFNNKGNQVFPGTNMLTAGQIPLNQWTRIDMLFSFARNVAGGSGNGGIILVINGNNVGRVTGNGPSGPAVGGAGGLFNVLQNHLSSYIGNENTPTNGLEIDYDDWTNKTQPVLFTGDDWNYGSHIMPLRVQGFGALTGVWTGGYQTLDGVPVNGQLDSVDNAAANTTLEVTTDYQDRQIGCTGFVCSLFNKAAGGTAENLGYRINGGAAVMQSVTTSTNTWAVPVSTAVSQILYSAGGNKTAPTLTSIAVRYARDAAATLRQVSALNASAEYLGFFGTNCDPGPAGSTPALVPYPFMHNTPYNDSIWAVTGGFGGGEGVVEAMTGTFVGNDTGQDITCRVPAHWVWIRPTGGGTGGARWWSTCLAGHDPTTETPNKSNFVRAFQDSTGAYKFSVSGSNANCNANGVTYQWVAFSDRRMRFCLNGSYLTLTGTASFQHNLLISNFTPLAGFLLPEIGTVASTDGFYYKGPGHATDAASIMNVAESATVIAFNSGSIAPKAILNLASAQTAYSLWRQTDGGGNVGAVAVTSYIGNGTGSRVIPLTGLGASSPLFVIVQPHNSVAYVKDPSHAATSSTPINSSVDSTTAITGGAAGQITVNATLNAGGIVYDVFALPGAAAFPFGQLIDPYCPLSPTIPIDPLPGSSVNGWWQSTNLFTGAATIVSYPPSSPRNARDWTKIAGYAAGNAGFFAGFPPPGVILNNRFFIYAGNDYQVGGTQPTIRIFDGTSDRLMITVPDFGGVKALAIMSMIIMGETIYFTTLDSGTTNSTYAGRVFQFNVNSLSLTQLGVQFINGECPYALCWHMGRLFMGTNKGDVGTAAKIYWFRPGSDTVWTQDRTLATDGVTGCLSLASYQGKLYAGCCARAVDGTNKILVRDSLGAYTTSFTLTSAGTFRDSNGVPAMAVFNNKLYASYWNPDTTPDCYLMQYDGTAWVKVYTGVNETVRPFSGLFVAKNTLFIVGGGRAQSACLLSSSDGSSWTNLTAFLTGPTTTITAMPIVTQMGT